MKAIGDIEAVQALIRLLTDKALEDDYVKLNLAISCTKWCRERGDFTDTHQIKQLALSVKKKAELLNSTKHDDPDAEKNWDDAQDLFVMANNYEQIARYGIDYNLD